MQTSDIINAINDEIERLIQARAFLSGTADPTAQTGARSKSTAQTKLPIKAQSTTQRVISIEGKARIAAAQKARWAAQRASDKPRKGISNKTLGKKITNVLSSKKKRTNEQEGSPSATGAETAVS